jgi:hypothetical protein
MTLACDWLKRCMKGDREERNKKYTKKYIYVNISGLPKPCSQISKIK